MTFIETLNIMALNCSRSLIKSGNFCPKLVSRKSLSEEYLSFDVGTGILSWQVVADEKQVKSQRKAGSIR
jgi:hypothetical protein